MNSPKWNERQLAAIEARGSNVLVAAAAGSGKTAVLVERLLRRVTEDGVDVSRFLVVTFTRAAASEMLSKFTNRLTKAAAASPDDRRLRRQLRLLPRARVTTVHGFCSSLLREHFQAAIQSYIKDEDKDISTLMEYARERKVVKKVQSLIGVWL